MGWGAVLYNFIGACVRWLYGTIWRTIAHKEKFQFHEYLYGPDNSDDYFDNVGHQFVNKVIGIITLVVVIFGILKLSSNS